MTADPKLVEAIARAIAAKGGYDYDRLQPDEAAWAANYSHADYPDSVQSDFLESATAALAAINASGEWWVAPVELTHSMQRAGNPANGAHYIVGDPPVVWDAMRDAYLNIPIPAYLAKTEAG